MSVAYGAVNEGTLINHVDQLTQRKRIPPWFSGIVKRERERERKFSSRDKSEKIIYSFETLNERLSRIKSNVAFNRSGFTTFLSVCKLHSWTARFIEYIMVHTLTHRK